MKEFTAKFCKWSYVSVTFVILIIWIAWLSVWIITGTQMGVETEKTIYDLVEPLAFLISIPLTLIFIRKWFNRYNCINLTVVPDVVMQFAFFNKYFYMPADWDSAVAVIQYMVIYKMIHIITMYALYKLFKKAA